MTDEMEMEPGEAWTVSKRKLRTALHGALVARDESRHGAEQMRRQVLDYQQTNTALTFKLQDRDAIYAAQVHRIQDLKRHVHLLRTQLRLTGQDIGSIVND
jgi:hypothetical protein